MALHFTFFFLEKLPTEVFVRDLEKQISVLEVTQHPISSPFFNAFLK